VYPATQTYWLEPTPSVAIGQRRYSSSDGKGWTCADGYHQALHYTGTAEAVFREEDGRRYLAARPEVPRDHPVGWPRECDAGCGYRFTDDDHWQTWQELIYYRADTGEYRVLHQGAPAPFAPSAEPGAMWDAWWMPFSRGADGICLIVRCPNGRDWHVDSEASNCTRKGEPHQCWVRHGDPRECQVTVDKNGDTCAAGAGSILAGDYHGFLQAGILTAG